MATTSNRTWAFTEATRRAGAMAGAYAIYRHRRNTDDYIVRTVQAAKPAPNDWQHVATVERDGTFSFQAD